MNTIANDKQVGGDHYKTVEGLQHWDVVHLFKLDYFQGQITKYMFRWRKKNGVEDLRKAAHFLQKYIELNEPPANCTCPADIAKGMIAHLPDCAVFDKGEEAGASYVNQD